jgi:hypothetical protein
VAAEKRSPPEYAAKAASADVVARDPAEFAKPKSRHVVALGDFAFIAVRRLKSAPFAGPFLVVISGPFINFLLHNHIINIK